MKIRGRFCERKLASKASFDKRSFRWKKSGRAKVLVGCPKGKFKNGVCSVGTKAYAVLVASKGACRVGERVVRKGR